MYFLLRSAPLDLSADRLHGLRLSLNTPVVSIEEVPVEPARAAIVVHDEIDGRPNVTVGIYALRSEVGVLFSFERSLRDTGALTNGVDAALSFGESMGFLFDEDELEPDSGEEARFRALNLWLELMSPPSGEPEQTPQTSAAPEASSPAALEASSPAALEASSPGAGPKGVAEAQLQSDEVLLLEEVADPQDDLPDVRIEAPDAVESAPPVLLSKFRHCASDPPPSPSEESASPDVAESRPASKGTALGRLKLIKRRPDGNEALSKPSVIRRLLSSF
jgi:hypothetical protein